MWHRNGHNKTFALNISVSDEKNMEMCCLVLKYTRGRFVGERSNMVVGSVVCP